MSLLVLVALFTQVAPPAPPTGLTARVSGAVATVGTLVGGVCKPFGTGTHLDGATKNAKATGNEMVGNCVLP